MRNGTEKRRKKNCPSTLSLSSSRSSADDWRFFLCGVPPPKTQRCRWDWKLLNTQFSSLMELEHCARGKKCRVGTLFSRFLPNYGIFSSSLLIEIIFSSSSFDAKFSILHFRSRIVNIIIVPCRKRIVESEIGMELTMRLSREDRLNSHLSSSHHPCTDVNLWSTQHVCWLSNARRL